MLHFVAVQPMATERQSETEVQEAKVGNTHRKHGTHWCSSVFTEHLWRPTSGCRHTEEVSVLEVTEAELTAPGSFYD